jgi:hypothetical protein
LGDYGEFGNGFGTQTPTVYKNQNVIDHYQQIVFCPYYKTMTLKEQLLQEIEQAPKCYCNPAWNLFSPINPPFLPHHK